MISPKYQTNAQSMLDAARQYAAQGISIIPVLTPTTDKPHGELSEKENDGLGKAPANCPNFYHGSKDATTDLEKIQGAWGSPQGTTPRNIGIATGEKYNLVVVDVDDPAKWNELLDNHGYKVPPCPKVTTGKGFHLYFSYPGTRGISNSTNKSMGFDIRSNGGYVVAPPSNHLSGEVYTLENNESLVNCPELPNWVFDLLTEDKANKAAAKKTANTKLDFNTSKLAANDPSPYGMKALERECQAIVSAPQGTRNDLLNKACFNIGGLVAGGEIDNYLALNYLTQAAKQSGLPTEEIAKTLASGFKAGKDNPRTAPEAQGSISQGVAESLTWDKTKELKAELLPVKPLDPEMLPNTMRDYITDIAERMDNSSPDYVAVGVMVALATLIGRKLSILPKQHDTWLVVPNLWGAAIGRPSAKKTPSLTSAMAPLHTFESKEFQKHGIAMQEHIGKVKLAKLTEKVTEKKFKQMHSDGKSEEADSMLLKSLGMEPEQPPACKRFIVNDATVEKLGELLGSNPMGVLLFRDELTGWLNTLDKPDRASDRAFYLECWSGTGSFTYDRIGRGTQRIESATLSLMGGIQPGKLIPYLTAQKEGKGDDGLIERFQLMVYPDPQPYKHVDRPPNAQALRNATSIFAMLDDLPGELNNPTILKFSPEAQRMFNTWYDNNQKLVRSATLTPQLESHLAKYVSLFPSLALIIHAVDSSPGGDIGIDSANKALAWCEYLESHVRRVYALADGPIGSAKALQKRLHEMPNPFRIGAINNKNWHGLTTTDQIHEALDSLCEHGHLQKIVSRTTRPATDYFKHPMYCNS